MDERKSMMDVELLWPETINSIWGAISFWNDLQKANAIAMKIYLSYYLRPECAICNNFTNYQNNEIAKGCMYNRLVWGKILNEKVCEDIELFDK